MAAITAKIPWLVQRFMAAAETGAAAARVHAQTARHAVGRWLLADVEATTTTAATAATDSESSDHAVFGACLASHGAKTVFSAPLSALTDKSVLSIWQKQRSFCSTRAMKLAEEKMSDKNPLERNTGFAGSITIVEGNDGNLVCIDGQHRLGALAHMLEVDSVAPDTPVLVELFRSQDVCRDMGPNFDLASRLFVEINKAEPVRAIDMPGAANPAEKEILESVCADLGSEFRAMFKPSSRCRPPHVHGDSLKDLLFVAGALGALKVDSADAVKEHVLRVNAEMEQWSQGRWIDLRGRHSEKVILKALDKSAAHGFWLGMPGAQEHLVASLRRS